MQKRPNFLRLSLMAFLSLTLVLGIARLTPAQEVQLPAAVRNCTLEPTLPVIVRVEQIASTRFQGRDYYLLAVYDSENQAFDWVVSIANGQCREELLNTPGDVISLTRLVGQDVARQLALGRYRRDLQRNGREKIQQRINRAAAAPNGLFYPEDVWALRQLGFSIPSNVRVTE